jgi:hypothetical protein
MSEETPPSPPEKLPPVSSERTRLISEPAAIFIAAATLFAIFINSQNAGVILMLGVIALLIEARYRSRG